MPGEPWSSGRQTTSVQMSATDGRGPGAAESTLSCAELLVVGSDRGTVDVLTVRPC
jgi:hypothetical protein